MDTVRTDKADTTLVLDNSPDDSAIEIKGSVFTLPVLKICTPDTDQLEKALKKHLAQSLSFFKNAPIVIDLERIKQLKTALDFKALTRLLRAQQLVPVAVQKGSLEQHLEAEKAGLAILTGQASTKTKQPDVASVRQATSSQDSSEDSGGRTADREVAPVTSANAATKMVTQPIRSGQRIYARGGDLIVLAAVNAGAEVMADGNIHIYAPLRGRALAGVQGDQNSRIFCHCMEAELIAIAGSYRVFEDKVPAEFRQKAVQICLRGEQLDVVLLQ
ncbi:MAG TPA: septum site-determining protein MinC [Gammaproteobacteria bacterium]